MNTTFKGFLEFSNDSQKGTVLNKFWAKERQQWVQKGRLRSCWGELLIRPWCKWYAGHGTPRNFALQSGTGSASTWCSWWRFSSFVYIWGELITFMDSLMWFDCELLIDELIWLNGLVAFWLIYWFKGRALVRWPTGGLHSLSSCPGTGTGALQYPARSRLRFCWFLQFVAFVDSGNARSIKNPILEIMGKYENHMKIIGTNIQIIMAIGGSFI